MPITGPLLQEKAMQIAQGLDISQDEFKASNGWLNRFKSRNRIKAKFISGEAGDVREETVDSWKERLPELHRRKEIKGETDLCFLRECEWGQREAHHYWQVSQSSML